MNDKPISQLSNAERTAFAATEILRFVAHNHMTHGDKNKAILLARNMVEWATEKMAAENDFSLRRIRMLDEVNEREIPF